MLFNIEPLRMWVHKVLPVVYDDSLSYYEVLAKTVRKLNEVIDLTDEQTKFIQEFSDNLTDAINEWEEGLTDEWTEYKEKINTEWENYKSNTDADIELWEHLKEIEIERAVAEGIYAFAEYFEGIKNQAVDAADRAGDEADRAEAAADEAAENAVEAVMPTLEGIFDNRYAFKSAIGSPLVAQTATEMTDTNKIYVYVGNETGYVNGNWYYYDGTAWESGGVYNSVAVVTDTTLSEAGVPADAKATGDEINNVKNIINGINNLTPIAIPITWVQGGINATGGNANATNRIRTNYIDVTSIHAVNITVASGYAWRIFHYSASGFTTAYGPSSESTTRTIPEGTTRIRFYLRKVNDSDLTPEEGVNFSLTYDIPIVSTISENSEKIETLETDVDIVENTINDINNLSNIAIPITWVQGGIGTSGGNADAANRIRTNYIDVSTISAINITVANGYAWRIFHYSEGGFTTAYGPSSASTTRNIPEGTTRIRFYLRKTDDSNLTPEEGVNFSISYNVPVVAAINANTNEINNIVWCQGKKLNWIGDSIVAGADFDEEVTNALKIIETDYGINGSTIALSADGTDGRNAICLRYANMTDDADIIAVSCGTNDFEYAWCPIGDINSSENTTFYGALKTLCEGLINKYPQKIIFFTTPIKRGQAFENGNGGEYTADGIPTTPFSKNKYGKTLADYADIIKEVCGLYSIPVLDMNRESLLNPHLTSQQNLFDSALTHPNAVGQKIMARRICGWLIQLGYKI